MLTDVRVRDRYVLRKPLLAAKTTKVSSKDEPNQVHETGILEALAAGHPFGETLFTPVLATWC